jgi:hypothetical protein
LAKWDREAKSKSAIENPKDLGASSGGCTTSS